MALIKCPECGNEISDKVKACPHCGFPFETNQDNKKEVQQVELSAINITPKKSKTTKYILIGVLSLVAIAVIGLLVNYFLGIKKYNDYIDNLNATMVTMLDGGSEAESLLNLTAKVWFNTIYQEYDVETDKYTKSSFGIWHEDFNDALAYLFSDSQTKTTIAYIEDNQDLVDLMMKDLSNPPKGLEKCHETITDLYSIYRSLTNLAINPSGSYNSFTESKNEKIDDFLDTFNKLEVQIPEKK